MSVKFCLIIYLQQTYIAVSLVNKHLWLMAELWDEWEELKLKGNVLG